jgi:hypothetical protein
MYKTVTDLFSYKSIYLYFFLVFTSHVFVRGLTNNARCSVSAKNNVLIQARETSKPSSPLKIKAQSNFVNGPVNIATGYGLDSPGIKFWWRREFSHPSRPALGPTLPTIQNVSKRALQLWKLIEIYTEDIHNVLICQNVAKHTEFYLG